jgi:predicted metal-dependent phosphoesterase TrpH
VIIDLHCHTTASDGTLSPQDVVARALHDGVDVIAITDHDTTDGVEAAVRTGVELGVRVVPGIEVSARHEGRNVHVLGYFLDHTSLQLRSALSDLREARIERAKRIVAKLNELGYAISWDDVLEQANGRVVARPHIARALVARGHIDSVKQAFSPDLFADGGRADVPKQTLTAFQAIGVIRAAGGASVIAHPGVGHHDGELRAVREELVEALCATGLKGIEVDHPDHPPLMRDELYAMADRLGLVATGGSDFHGEPGHVLGSYRTSPGMLERLEASTTT